MTANALGINLFITLEVLFLFNCITWNVWTAIILHCISFAAFYLHFNFFIAPIMLYLFTNLFINLLRFWLLFPSRSWKWIRQCWQSAWFVLSQIFPTLWVLLFCRFKFFYTRVLCRSGQVIGSNIALVNDFVNKRDGGSLLAEFSLILIATFLVVVSVACVNDCQDSSVLYQSICV